MKDILRSTGKQLNRDLAEIVVHRENMNGINCYSLLYKKQTMIPSVNFVHVRYQNNHL